MNESHTHKWTPSIPASPQDLGHARQFRHFVNQIQRNGLNQPSPSEGDEQHQVADAESEPEVEAEAEAETTNDEIAKAVEGLKAQACLLSGPNADVKEDRTSRRVHTSPHGERSGWANF